MLAVARECGTPVWDIPRTWTYAKLWLVVQCLEDKEKGRAPSVQGHSPGNVGFTDDSSTFRSRKPTVQKERLTLGKWLGGEGIVL